MWVGLKISVIWGRYIGLPHTIGVPISLLNFSRISGTEIEAKSVRNVEGFTGTAQLCGIMFQYNLFSRCFEFMPLLWVSW